MPSIHIPQLYYFVAFSSVFGFPVLISGKGGVRSIVKDVWSRMFGSKLYVSGERALPVFLFTVA